MFMRRAYPNDCTQAHTDRLKVNSSTVPLDYTRLLQFSHTFTHRRLRQSDSLSESRQTLARIRL